MFLLAAPTWQKVITDCARAVLVHAGVDILTFGQYLQPTPKHLEVTEFVTPEKFEHWRRYGEEIIGFRYSSPSTVVMWLYGMPHPQINLYILEAYHAILNLGYLTVA